MHTDTLGTDVPLDVARAIEHTVGLCRSVLEHLEHGPFRRTRRRVRRQVRKLVRLLDRVQLAALAGPLAVPVDEGVRGVLVVVDPQLERALYHPADKAQLKAMRKVLQRVRRELADDVRLPRVAAK